MIWADINLEHCHPVIGTTKKSYVSKKGSLLAWNVKKPWDSILTSNGTREITQGAVQKLHHYH